MAFKGEGRDFSDLGEMTEGLSSKGMEAYLEALKANLLVKVGESLDETTALEAAINKGWQGVSRDKFMTQFNKAIEATKEDLVAEYYDLVNKLSELAQSYYEQDANMIID